MCGEKAASSGMLRVTLGSPPHVRGKVCLFLEPAVDVGITPACAGKRQEHTAKSITSGDHPRMCGEKFNKKLHKEIGQGSPPHVRGKV